MRKIKKVLGICVAALLSLWLIVFVANTLRGSKVGFDYDDTVCFSTPSFMAASEKYTMKAIGSKHPDNALFWAEVNSDPGRDIRKPLTWTLINIFKLLGIKVVLITAREGISTGPFESYWGDSFSEYHFTKEKAKILGSGGYLAFFGDSDSDMSEAQKAGVLGIRIQRNPASSYQKKYNPGSLGEFVVPDSEGPSS